MEIIDKILDGESLDDFSDKEEIIEALIYDIYDDAFIIPSQDDVSKSKKVLMEGLKISYCDDYDELEIYPSENEHEIDLKDFSQKLPMEDIKPICLRAISEVMKYGRQKYGNGPDQKCSYENGEIDSYIGALLRHLNEYQFGNKTDCESELPHLWHVLMNAYIICLLDEKEK